MKWHAKTNILIIFMKTKRILKSLNEEGDINKEYSFQRWQKVLNYNFVLAALMYHTSPMWLIANFLNKFFLVYFISIPALKSPDEYLIKCTKANIFDRADVLTAFFTYKLLCATVRQRYFCICDKKDVSNDLRISGVTNL